MRARGMLLVFVVVTLVFGTLPSMAETRYVHIRNCEFSPQPRFADPNDNVTWLYEEGGCPDNHRVTTYGNPPEHFDSGPCGGRNSFDPDCLNTLPGRSPSFTYRPTKPGNYPYYCPIHGEISSDGVACTGMCGLLKVNPLPSGGGGSATATATAKATGSASPKGSASPSPSRSASVSPTPSGSVSASATATPSELAKKAGSSGGGRAVIAVAAVALLGVLGFMVWRAFIAQQP